MSSTNRNSKVQHKRILNNDYYVTPQKDIDHFIKELFAVEGDIFIGKKILDPCCGGDENNEMSYPTVLNRLGYDVDTIDIRNDSPAKIKGDYLKMDLKNKYDVIITNPPFNISLDIIKKALNDVCEGGYVIMLLRLNYFGSITRFNFWKETMPIYTFVHHKRISFSADNRCDSIEYMHVVFKKGHNNGYTKLMVI